MKPTSSIAEQHFSAWPKISLRIFLLTILLIGGLGQGLLVMPVSAQSNGIEMVAAPAFDGYFKYGEWLPIWVELTNQGQDVEAEIKIQVNGSQGTMVFQAPVSLPSGAHKLIPVYVLPNNFSRELSILLVSNDETIASAKATVRPQPNISYFAGLLAPERGALGLLNGITFPGQERPKVLVDISLDQLPDRSEGLRSFDLLVLNDLDTSKLTPEQGSALKGWVQAGGRLVIGGGAGAQHTLSGLPAEFLPIEFNNTSEVGPDLLKPIAQFAASDPIQLPGPFILAQVQGKDSRILAGSSKQPVITERNWGAGFVDFVAFDLAGVPFNGWPGTQPFWEALLGQSRAYPDNMPFDVSPRQYRANSLTYALSNIPSLDLPSIQGVTILLIIYILMVGPVNYLFLRARKRLHWAWITIPVITALFTAGAFGIGYTLRGNDLILNKIAIVEAKPDGNAAVTSYMGLFSPRMQSYEVSVQGEGLISPMSMDMGPWNATGTSGTGGEMIFVQGQPSVVKGLTVNQWAMQSFMSEGNWKDFGKITGSLRIENEVLVGKVRNESQYTITDAVLTMQSRFVRLGDLAPGAEKEINLGLSSLQSDRFGTPLSYRLFQENFTNGPMPRALEQKSNIISTMFENLPQSKLSSAFPAPGNGPTAGVTVFGWMDQAPPNVDVPNNALTQKTTALVYTSLTYDLPTSGLLALPPGLIPGSVIKLPQNGGTCGNPSSVSMGKGEATIEFQIPGNLQDLQVQTLKLALWRDNGNQWGMPEVSVYNWKDKVWTTIQEPIQGNNIIQKAGPYVSDNGSVQVQIKSESDTFGCIYLDLGLEAERQAGQGG